MIVEEENIELIIVQKHKDIIYKHNIKWDQQDDNIMLLKIELENLKLN